MPVNKPRLTISEFTPSSNYDTDFVRTVAKAAYANIPTLVTTMQLCHQALAAGVPGDLVECGVAAGAQSAIMADAWRRAGSPPDRFVRLFDSFEGIPEAGPKDDESITGLIGKPAGQARLVSTGFVAVSQDRVKANMRAWGLPSGPLRYHEGWFQHTVGPFAKEGRPIAVLRLDGDLYESTKVCLEALHGLVPSGGYVIIDDFALTGCRLACEEFLAMHGLSYRIHSIKGGGGPVFWQKT